MDREGFSTQLSQVSTLSLDYSWNRGVQGLWAVLAVKSVCVAGSVSFRRQHQLETSRAAWSWNFNLINWLKKPKTWKKGFLFTLQISHACTHTPEGPREAGSKRVGVGGQEADTHLHWQGPRYAEESYWSERTDSSVYIFFSRKKKEFRYRNEVKLSLQCQVLFQSYELSLNQMKCNSQDPAESTRNSICYYLGLPYSRYKPWEACVFAWESGVKQLN